jgi:hypothetical protein
VTWSVSSTRAGRAVEQREVKAAAPAGVIGLGDEVFGDWLFPPRSTAA